MELRRRSRGRRFSLKNSLLSAEGAHRTPRPPLPGFAGCPGPRDAVAREAGVGHAGRGASGQGRSDMTMRCTAHSSFTRRKPAPASCSERPRYDARTCQNPPRTRGSKDGRSVQGHGSRVRNGGSAASVDMVWSAAPLQARAVRSRLDNLCSGNVVAEVVGQADERWRQGGPRSFQSVQRFHDSEHNVQAPKRLQRPARRSRRNQ